jgi:hypothetical protein
MSYRCLICEGKGFFIKTVKYSKNGMPLVKESKSCSFCGKDFIVVDELLLRDINTIFSEKNLIH